MVTENRQQRRHPSKTIDMSKGRLQEIDTKDIRFRDLDKNPVPLAKRQGVFAFMLKCPACQLEFVVLSWRAERPAEVAITCPECQSGVFLLGRVVLSARKNFSLNTLHAFDETIRGTDVEITTVGSILAAAAEGNPGYIGDPVRFSTEREQ